MDEARRLLEEALALIRDVPLEYRNWDWLAQFDDEDLSEFCDQIRSLLGAGEVEGLAQALFSWERGAELLADPLAREIHLGPHSDDDFVEVGRPGGDETVVDNDDTQG